MSSFYDELAARLHRRPMAPKAAENLLRLESFYSAAIGADFLDEYSFSSKELSKFRLEHSLSIGDHYSDLIFGKIALKSGVRIDELQTFLAVMIGCQRDFRIPL